MPVPAMLLRLREAGCPAGGTGDVLLVLGGNFRQRSVDEKEGNEK